MEIKFVSYKGEYPNLCDGPLTLLIDGKETTFGDGLDFSDGKIRHVHCDYPVFWKNSGIVNIDTDNNEYFVTEGVWVVSAKYLPDFLRPYANELADILNSNIPRGHCGGCL